MTPYDAWKTTDPSDDGWQEAFEAWLDKVPEEDMGKWAVEWMQNKHSATGVAKGKPDERYGIVTVSYEPWNDFTSSLRDKFEEYLEDERREHG